MRIYINEYFCHFIHIVSWYCGNGFVLFILYYNYARNHDIWVTLFYQFYYFAKVQFSIWLYGYYLGIANNNSD